MPDLNEVWAKFNRACEHEQMIDTTLQAFLDEHDPYHVTHNSENDGWYRFRWSVRPDVHPPLTAFSLHFGDMLYNLRASLDYLVWQLALANNATPTDRHAFPCVCEEAGWDSAVGDRLKGIERRWIDAIGDLQPFHAAKRGDDARLHWLAMLHHLNNVNKHRLSSPSVWSLAEFAHRIEFLRETGQTEVPFEFPSGPIEDDAILFGHQLAGVAGRDFQVHMDEAPTVQITFRDGLDHDWKRADLIGWVRGAIAVFEPAFPS